MWYMEREKNQFLRKAGEKLSFVSGEALDMSNSVCETTGGEALAFFLFFLPALWLVNDK